MLLEQAIEMVDNAFGAVGGEPAPPPAANQNDQAIAQLMGMKAQLRQ